MKPFTVTLNLTASSADEAREKAKILQKVSSALTMSNLNFVGELAEKKTINKKLSNPLIRTGIKSKL